MFRPSVEECREHLSYDAKTGVITWIKPTAARMKPGSVAGSMRRDGYRRVSFKGGIIVEHRLAWALHFGEWPNGWIDHINRVRDDNRITNLRIATPSENAKNREHRKPGQMRHGGSGVTMHKRTGKWQVQVHCPNLGRAIYGGLFHEKEDAEIRASELRLEFDI